MKTIMKTVLVSIASLSLMFAAKAGELSVSGSAKATYNIVQGAQVDNGIGVTNELNFTASGEMDNGYTWTYSTELDPSTNGTTSNTSGDAPGQAINDDSQITLTLNDFGMLKFCVSECGSNKKYAFDHSAYTSMSDTGYSEGIIYPGDAGGMASIQYHSPELPFGTTVSYAMGQKTKDGASGNATGLATGVGNGANGDSMDEYSLVTSPIDGLKLSASYYEYNDYGDGQGATHDQLEEGGAYGVTYALGNISLGYGKSFKAPAQDGITSGATDVEYYENKGLSIGYAVNDDLSVSYTQEESSRNMLTSSTATYDIDMDSVQLAYSLGGATLSVARATYDNVGYADGVDATETIVALSFAF
jgi:outer membrane protein OmpU